MLRSESRLTHRGRGPGGRVWIPSLPQIMASEPEHKWLCISGVGSTSLSQRTEGYMRLKAFVVFAVVGMGVSAFARTTECTLKYNHSHESKHNECFESHI